MWLVIVLFVLTVVVIDLVMVYKKAVKYREEQRQKHNDLEMGIIEPDELS